MIQPGQNFPAMPPDSPTYPVARTRMLTATVDLERVLKRVKDSVQRGDALDSSALAFGLDNFAEAHAAYLRGPR